MDQIKECSKTQFKSLVDKCVEKRTLAYLNDEKAGKSKVLHIEFKELKIQKYLEPNKHSTQLGKFTFLVRSRMLEVAENFKNGKKSSKCPVCEEESSTDSQPHLFLCPKLTKNQVAKNSLRYENLFEDNLEAQTDVTQILQNNFKERKKKLKSKK